MHLQFPPARNASQREAGGEEIENTKSLRERGRDSGRGSGKQLSFVGKPGPEERIRKSVFIFALKKDVELDKPCDRSFHC